MHGKILKSKQLPVCLFLFFAFLPGLAKAIDIFPVEPQAGQVFNSTNDVTFTCDASDEGQIRNITLFHDLNGTFSANMTEHYGETYFDSNTSFLCNFNGNLACQASGSGLPQANSSLSFDEGKFSQGVLINETGILIYQSSGNFDRNQGTIEFWISPPDDISNKLGYIFQAAYNDDDTNQMEIYFISGILRFEMQDSSEGMHRATSDISSWAAGSWHHVAAVWDLDGDIGDGNPLDIYTDGELQESYECDPCFPISYLSAPSSMSMGSNKNNNTQANATIDDFRISSVVRSASEINEKYYKGLGDYSSVSESWPFYSVSDGSYTWRCVAYDNDSQENSSSIMSFYVDMATPPSVNAIHLSPNSSDDIDPGATINATANVSDPSGVNTAIFQWKEIGDESWNNMTMAYNASSGLYWNASFQTLIMESVYYYRIWSNDSKGNSSYSLTQNVTAAWDYTWTRSPASFGTVSGLINSRSNVGILTINNTGDRTLNFTIFDNWPLYYNGSDNTNFYVANHTTITINITAQFASESSENDIFITINASHPIYTPSPVSLSANATINSYSGGPYLTVAITEYTGMVSQSQTFNLSARVKSIGNETAENVWLNWSLPAGWENISGNITYFAGNLSSGSFFLSNITITISPSAASPGTFIIYANSSCSQNISGHDSKTVGVSCSNSDGVCGYDCSYVNDNDCSIPSAPGGGTTETVFVGGRGGGDQTVQYMMRMEAPSMLDIQRGEKKTAKIKIINEAKKTNLTSIYLAVSGYPLSQIRINPAAISRLEYNQTGWFEVEFFVPNYTRYGIHNLTLKTTASGSTSTTKNLTNIERTAGMAIVVYSVHENDTKAILGEAEKAVREMADAGLSTEKAKSLLEQAKSQISSWDYDTSLETSKQVLELREKSFHVSSLINQVEESIREAEGFGIQTPESRKMSELSKSALQREDYAKAEERASSAVAAFMIESQGLETMRFIYANWQFIIVGSAVFAGAIYFAYRKSLKGRLRKRMGFLSMEEKAIRKLMENAQEEHYKERTLSSIEYHRLMSEHETRLVKIRKRKSRLNRKLIKLEKHSLPEFKKQEASLRSEIQELQKKYYEQGSVTKSSYQKSVDELREELAESIKNIDIILERRSPGKKGRAGFLILGMLLSVIFAGMVLAQADDKQAALNAMANAEGWIKDMEQLGFPTTRANDTLNEAELLFSNGFYKGAESLANDIEGIKERAISIDITIDETEVSIYQARSLGINVFQPQSLFDEALESFKQEDYGRSEELLSQTTAKLEELESDYSMSRITEGRGLEGLLNKIKDNALLSSTTILALVAVGIVSTRYRKRVKIRNKIEELDAESEKINSMIKGLQSNYFKKKAISESEYRTLMARYRKKLSAMKRKRLVLEGMLNKKQTAKRES